ncbi:MAG: hypothetical protein O2887_10430 [Bacteroidetes bacterium]|nr:hypothetical protein [Bacteroidota bacterium]
MIYLRFTNTAQEDLNRGTSLLDLPSLESPIILPGLCGFKVGDEYSSQEEIDVQVKSHIANTYYSGTPTLFEGHYIQSNPNGEGSVFTPISIIN